LAEWTLGTLIRQMGVSPTSSAAIKYALVSGLMALVGEDRVADRVQHLHVFGVRIVSREGVVEIGVERHHLAADRLEHLLQQARARYSS
jgi:hypothetical protein